MTRGEVAVSSHPSKRAEPADRNGCPLPLDPRQRRLVEEHLPLVRAQLRRQTIVGPARAAARETDDLYQEGCVALVHAVRGYDAARHGPFAPYALSRIHAAMGRWLWERRDDVRVPVATQRRRIRRERSSDRHDPGGPPVVLRLDPDRLDRVPARPPDRSASHGDARPSGPTLGEALRARIDAAVRRAVSDALRRGRRGVGGGVLLRRLARERLSIPEPLTRTAVRALARELRVSLGRVTHAEASLYAGVRGLLSGDRAFRYLRYLARHRPRGMDAPLAPREQQRLAAALRRRNSARRTSREE